MTGKVKIVSDGTPAGTCVTMDDVVMKGVCEIHLKASLEGVTASLVIENIELIVDGVIARHKVDLVPGDKVG
jgi:hypothetical protein